jgi:hypothetical protein
MTAAEEQALREALLDIADPITAIQRKYPDLQWSAVLAKANDPEFFKGIALNALGNVHG